MKGNDTDIIEVENINGSLVVFVNSFEEDFSDLPNQVFTGKQLAMYFHIVKRNVFLARTFLTTILITQGQSSKRVMRNM